MSAVGERERKTQERVVRLFRDRLGYHYLGDWKERPNNSNIEVDTLRSYLQRQGSRDALIDRAITALQRAAGDSPNLYEANKKVYSLLRYGVAVKLEVGQNTETVRLIDWDTPHNNHFAIAEEVTIRGNLTKRPDIVLYVNGIALGVLELKRSSVAVSEGIRQNIGNQREEFIRPFFATTHWLMAGNDTEGLRYGTIGTPEKYYLSWKEPGAEENILDRALLQLCDKTRLLELIHDFIVFDAGTKKLCRHNQYFGVKAAQARVRAREGGILWHSQGSGKSLTMVWLAKWIKENVPEGRVLIITDRTELDEQIKGVFNGVNEEVRRTDSGQDLLTLLHQASPWLICSLVHKFGGKEGQSNEFLNELNRAARTPGGVAPHGQIFVFVDECHRTQSGQLHAAMKRILPHATFIGFTGTPLLAQDKQTSLEIFGSYIHTYKFDEAVQDGVVLDLRYEAREIEQALTSPARIDAWFAAKTRGLTDVALAQLKQKWGTMQAVLSSRSRLDKIVNDIMLDMETKPRLMSGEGNAMLVCESIYSACRFYDTFQKAGLTQCAIITSYQPHHSDTAKEDSGMGETERLEQYEIYRKMLGGQSTAAFESEAKRQFIETPGQMKLLIVVDKLLTGFDAPSATYLYIDKPMRDHGLFQAICRVNRLDGESKEYGYIVDYRDLFKSLERSISDYTSEALDGYAREDVEGLLKDRVAQGRERLETVREEIRALCEPVGLPPQSMQGYMRYFCGDTSDKAALKEREPHRVALYKLTAALVRAYANIASDLPAAESEAIKREVAYYVAIRDAIKLASGDLIDLKLYEPAMRQLIDTYIRADDSQVVSTLGDMTLIQAIVERGRDALELLPAGLRGQPEAITEAIENNIRRLIIDEEAHNPKYYEQMSDVLDELIQARKANALEYAAYLEKLIALARAVQDPGQTTSYPPSLNSRAKRALYDNLGGDEQLALALDGAIRTTKQDGWRETRIKGRMVELEIKKLVRDPDEARRIFDLVRNQDDY